MTIAGEAEHKVMCLVTAPKDQAVTIARAIVAPKLAACVNIIPAVQSIYWWQGEIDEEEEALLVVKTTEAALPALTEALHAVHPYETFELISFTIDGGNLPYLDWITDSVVIPK